MAYIVKRGRAYDAELLRSFDAMVQQGFGAAGVNLSPFPAVDVREEDDRYVIEAELPGYSHEHVDIEVKDRVLTIASAAGTEEREEEPRSSGKRRLRPFSRRFSLPKHADPSHVEAAFLNGLLIVTVHKQPEAQPRKIQIDLAN